MKILQVLLIITLMFSLTEIFSKNGKNNQKVLHVNNKFEFIEKVLNSMQKTFSFMNSNPSKTKIDEVYGIFLGLRFLKRLNLKNGVLSNTKIPNQINKLKKNIIDYLKDSCSYQKNLHKKDWKNFKELLEVPIFTNHFFQLGKPLKKSKNYSAKYDVKTGDKCLVQSKSCKVTKICKKKMFPVVNLPGYFITHSLLYYYNLEYFCKKQSTNWKMAVKNLKVLIPSAVKQIDTNQKLTDEHLELNLLPLILGEDSHITKELIEAIMKIQGDNGGWKAKNPPITKILNGDMLPEIDGISPSKHTTGIAFAILSASLALVR